MNRSVRDGAVSVSISTAAAVLAVAISMAIVALAGQSPTAAADAMLSASFGSKKQLGATLHDMVPLTLAALGWVVAFSARRINIGLQGQILSGGLGATIVGLHFSGTPRVVHLLLIIAAGLVFGAAWAGIAAVLWAKRGVNEIISTLLLNFVMVQIVSWLANGPLEEPTHSLGQTLPIAASARWPVIGSMALAWDIVLVPLAVGVVAWAMSKTSFGYRLRITGSNAHFAAYSGIAVRRVAVTSLVLSGCLAGLAGSSLIAAGTTGTMAPGFEANYGFDGIVIALLARNHPVGCIPAAFLFAFLQQGGGLMEARVGAPSGLIFATQGIVIVLVAGSAVIVKRLRSQRLDISIRPGSTAVSAEAS